MEKYALNPDPKKSVKVSGRGLRISTKNSVIVCRAISGMNFTKGRRLLSDFVSEKQNLDGKHYTNISSTLLDLLDSAKNNAEFKGMEPEKMIIHASAHKGFRFFRNRRFKMRRQKRKITNIQMILLAK